MTSLSSDARSALVGYTVISGICTNNKFSIIEDFSFNSISVSIILYQNIAVNSVNITFR